MKNIIALFTVLVLLGGCKYAGELPSLKHCDHIVYERVERDATLEAHCTMPYGGM